MNRLTDPFPGWEKKGFTIIELLTAVAILALMLTMVFSILGQTSTLWRRASGKIDAFQNARAAFELLTRNLSQATLNTYLDYDDVNLPTRYLRKSELKFIMGQAKKDLELSVVPGTGKGVFFQAPANYATNANYQGLDMLLNTCGYFVQFAPNRTIPEHAKNTAPNPPRYRLMQLLVNTETNVIYSAGSKDWYKPYAATASAPAGQPSYVRAIAENVILLAIRPIDPDPEAQNAPDGQRLPEDYTYDSTKGVNDKPFQPITANQLPPALEVTMVAIDENSAKRMDDPSGGSSQEPSAITSALAGRFINTKDYAKDLEALKTALSTANIQYRVFSSTIPMRESKWTK